MKTLQDRYALALEKRGYRRIEARTDKYIVYGKPADPNHWYLGYAGSVRRGRTATGSTPASDKFKAILLAELAGPKPVEIDLAQLGL